MGQKWIGAYRHILCLLFFCAGVISLQCLHNLFSHQSYLVAAFCALAASVLVGYYIGGQGFRLLLYLLLLFAIGHAWAGFNAAKILSRQLAPELQKQDIVVEGRVLGMVRTTVSGIRFDFKVDRGWHSGRQVAMPEKIRLSVYSTEFTLQSSEFWRFTVRLKRPHGLSNPGSAFHYEAQLFHHRIGATGYVRHSTSQKLEAIGGFRDQLMRYINSLRADYIKAITSPKNVGRNTALVGALVTGVREGIQPSDWNVLQRTGTAHLVAISGLHVGLVTGFVALLAGALWRTTTTLSSRIPAPAAGLFVGAVAAALYGLVAGLTLPTQRALIMLGIVVVAIFLKRRALSLDTLGFAMFTVLLIDPVAPISNGFWMSFVAVAILMVVGRSRQIRLSDSNGMMCRIQGFTFLWLKIQWWLLVAMMPLSLIGFQKVSLIAPLANLVAVPVIGILALPLALVSLLLYAIGAQDLAVHLAGYAVEVVSWLWLYLSVLSESWIAAVKTGTPRLSLVLAGGCGILLLLAANKTSMCWLGCIWLVPLFMRMDAPLKNDEFSLTMLDVGQGLSIVVRTASQTLVYDTGAAYPGGFNLSRIALLPYLRHTGTGRVDRLIVSHGDNDHIGGARELVRNIRVDSVLSVVSGHPDLPASTRPCEAGQRWQWDGVQFEILWPVAPESDTSTSPPVFEGNNNSCVLSVRAANGSALLSGDIERHAERELAKIFTGKLAHDLLVVPHHGSKTSSTATFVQRVSPAYALNSAGYLSRYGHPHSNVVERFQQRNIEFLNTADDGAISVYFRRDGTTIGTHRATHRRFWKKQGKYDAE